MSRSFITGLLRHGSLEVAMGAVVMSMTLASGDSAAVPWVVYAALFLAVWFIYILDRLFDAQKIKAPAANPRHLFYQQHRRFLVPLLVILGALGLSLLPLLPVSILLYGMLLMGVCLLYLLVVFFSSRSLPKELVVAVLYTSGIALAPKALLGWANPWADGLIFATVLMLAFINLVLFSRHERQFDIHDQQASVLTTWSAGRIKLLLYVVFVLALASVLSMPLLTSATPAGGSLQLVFSAMLLVLWIMFRRPESFTNTTVYRLVGDTIFLMPVILLI